MCAQWVNTSPVIHRSCKHLQFGPVGVRGQSTCVVLTQQQQPRASCMTWPSGAVSGNFLYTTSIHLVNVYRSPDTDCFILISAQMSSHWRGFSLSSGPAHSPPAALQPLPVNPVLCVLVGWAVVSSTPSCSHGEGALFCFWLCFHT